MNIYIYIYYYERSVFHFCFKCFGSHVNIASQIHKSEIRHRAVGHAGRDSSVLPVGCGLLF